MDHSRDEYYMEHLSHSGDNRSRGWLYIHGPGIKKGATIDRPIYHPDTFATMSYIFNLETHKNDGKILRDCFL